MTIEVSSQQEKFRMDDIHHMLAKTWWCPDITKNEINKGIRNSALVVGAYTKEGKQVGFLRVISDKVRFAYFLDVVVHEDYRKQGIGQKMVRYALSHPDLKDVYQWVLRTRDAAGVYEKCGFGQLQNPERWMSIMKPRPDRTKFYGS